jgi:hypothetical protein
LIPRTAGFAGAGSKRANRERDRAGAARGNIAADVNSR